MQVVEDTSTSPIIVATIAGEPYTDVPQDLFIPPDALEVLLDSFTGPLDLLLYLIRRQNIDIMDIPILKITRQYMDYIELMEQRRLELAADYLVMAAMLAEIKSRLLLPIVSSSDDTVEEDPRMVLVRRLQIYEHFKNAANMIDSLVRCDRDVFSVKISTAPFEIIKPEPNVELFQLVAAMQSLCLEHGRRENHHVERELLSVRERMVRVLELIQDGHYVDFSRVYAREEGRMGLVVSVLAILELAKQSLLLISQTDIYAPIYIKANNDA